MRQIWYRFQFLAVALLLTATVIFGYLVIRRVHLQYDVTREKIHSLTEETVRVLGQLKGQPIEVVAFYPKDDPTREGLTHFLKQCQAMHPQFQFSIYDPVRRPKMAESYGIEQNYTTVIRSGDHAEKIYFFTEPIFTNALFRIAHPRKLDLCFTTGNKELSLKSVERDGIAALIKNLEGGEITTHIIVLARDGVPEKCSVTIMAGPHQELVADEFQKLKEAFDRGGSLVFLIDPMDLGTGRQYIDFFKSFGVYLGENVLVDKTSRVVGGDFLMPVVVNYTKHEAVRRMKDPTFFPVARTVQPSTDIPDHLQVSPLALTSEGSWAESDLVLLEEGRYSFDMKQDVAGPLPIAVAVETKKPEGGRMVIVGDSDFVTNGYLSLSDNFNFAMEILKWAGRDSRFIHVRERRAPFKPLLLKTGEKNGLLFLVLVVYPLALFVPIGLYLFIRSRTG